MTNEPGRRDDPGLAGGITILDVEDGSVISTHVMPITGGKHREVDAPGSGVDPQIRRADRPRRPRTSRRHAATRPIVNVQIRMHYGTTIGVVGALALPLELVSPVAWQRQILAGTNRGDKGAAAAYAARRWPGIDLRASERCRTPHDGITDALALAEYGRRLLVGRGE